MFPIAPLAPPGREAPMFEADTRRSSLMRGLISSGAAADVAAQRASSANERTLGLLAVVADLKQRLMIEEAAYEAHAAVVDQFKAMHPDSPLLSVIGKLSDGRHKTRSKSIWIAAFDDGTLPARHPACECQKHPCTRMTLRWRGKTRSGQPGRSRLSISLETGSFRILGAGSRCCEHRKPLSKRPLSSPSAHAAEVHSSGERSLGNSPTLSASCRQAAGEACTENAEGPGEPAAGAIWHPSTWDRVSPTLGKHHKGLKKKMGDRVDGFSCRYWSAPRISPDTGVSGSKRRDNVGY